ncbi:hypothetical protein COY31_01420 [Candidatus Wolfebacteria bacterium CG_4_10_14_0_2_um_filter_39_18]|uniref:Uncharacterized protein n=1 Tax=Candidatus Wolfebacteria bacterium CG_4_10_14_0_2_um_filter_39_18 TaxID=1975061 RepID=A0A2M7TG31_9BACT|nr:MAG: hypothetical protein COY31_01420 [Candidatus Wolfebacteria bacterium CG_4_10_14_0_2_um_filter_39_18]
MINKVKKIILNAAGLVPCGTSETPVCNWCYFGALASNIIDFMMYLVFPLAAVMIVVGGIFIMTSGGSSARFSKGKEIITAAVIGILIALLSWIIIDTIIQTIAVGWKGIVPTPWNKINLGC